MKQFEARRYDQILGAERKIALQTFHIYPLINESPGNHGTYATRKLGLSVREEVLLATMRGPADIILDAISNATYVPTAAVQNAIAVARFKLNLHKKSIKSEHIALKSIAYKL